jgi:hypothetical protein
VETVLGLGALADRAAGPAWCPGLVAAAAAAEGLEASAAPAARSAQAQAQGPVVSAVLVPAA